MAAGSVEDELLPIKQVVQAHVESRHDPIIRAAALVFAIMFLAMMRATAAYYYDPITPISWKGAMSSYCFFGPALAMLTLEQLSALHGMVVAAAARLALTSSEAWMVKRMDLWSQGQRAAVHTRGGVDWREHFDAITVMDVISMLYLTCGLTGFAVHYLMRALGSAFDQPVCLKWSYHIGLCVSIVAFGTVQMATFKAWFPKFPPWADYLVAVQATFILICLFVAGHVSRLNRYVLCADVLTLTFMAGASSFMHGCFGLALDVKPMPAWPDDVGAVFHGTYAFLITFLVFLSGDGSVNRKVNGTNSVRLLLICWPMLGVLAYLSRHMSVQSYNPMMNSILTCYSLLLCGAAAAAIVRVWS